MNISILRVQRYWFFGKAGLYIAILVSLLQGCSQNENLEPWHTKILDEEFTASMLDESVRSFDQYLQLETRLFKQLDQKIYAQTRTGPSFALMRYSRGSQSDPGQQQNNWNRTFEHYTKEPVGGVLLLHGMSDSPYSLRTLGGSLHERGYNVIGLRLPGHGTAPSGLRNVTWQDMDAAVFLAMDHLASTLGSKPIHMIGYSTGAPLALNYTLDAIEIGKTTIPASLVLISPAIRVHPTGAFAQFKNALSAIPGLESLAFLSIMDEFDPYKYNSFATNAGAQVHHLTRSVDQRIQRLARKSELIELLPPVLVLKSAVDSTVTTEAVVDNLLNRLSAGKNELVLFDINRNAAIKSTLLASDPGPLTKRLESDQTLPFAVTFVTNTNPDSNVVVARHKSAFSSQIARTEQLNRSWPPMVVSLSHIAIPFSPDDPLYGETRSDKSNLVFLGNLAFMGERGLLKIPADWLLRMRYNPFYDYFKQRTLHWLEGAQ